MKVIVEKIHSGCILQVKSGNRRSFQKYNPSYWNFKIGDDISDVIGIPVKITISDTNEEHLGLSIIIKNGKPVMSGGLPLRRCCKITREDVKDSILTK